MFFSINPMHGVHIGHLEAARRAAERLFMGNTALEGQVAEVVQATAFSTFTGPGS